MPKGHYVRSKGFKPKKVAAKPPELLKLDEFTLLRLEKMVAQTRAINSELIITNSLRQGFLQKIDPNQDLPKFDQRIQALHTERNATEALYKELLKVTGKKLGVDLADYAYDDETGVLRKTKEDLPAPPPE